MSEPPRTHWLRRWPGLVLALLAVLATAIDNRVIAQNARPGLAEFQRPPFELPIWLHGPMFAFLSLTIALIAGLLWYEEARPLALWWWVALLIAYGLWAPLSLGLRLHYVAAVEASIFLLLQLAGFFVFWRDSKMAALLLLPFMAWTTYLIALSYEFGRLNS
ncbi:tryptophan-rich sensory protein [Herbidospora daliensis]|uniref:tryptophan-rich sensory protein n=1 Tax=Herbidospora daliensis TaxID=295585 RepID=UPI000784E9CF|nr:TspO/MBR family protein [Herbidospora daliensis]